MVIEGDDDRRCSIAELFEAKGYRCDVCRDGHDGLVLLRDGARPNAILLDSMAPDLSDSSFAVYATRLSVIGP
ncbi:MAG: hypothetical protein RLZZ450_2976 [Pseudomonadota bacterium]|jgi:DNA-binding response OmpR family regulator